MPFIRDTDFALQIMNLLSPTISRLLQVCQTFAINSLRSSSALGRSRLSWVAVFSLLLALAPAGALGQSSQITISPTTLLNPVAGVPYNQTFTAAGGVGAKSFTLSAGTLPTGLSLSTSGTLSGTPTTAGTFIFLITATDTAQGASSAGYTLVVLGPPSVTTPVTANVSAGSATLGGTVTSDGGLPLSARGVVYSLTASNPNPLLGGSGVINATATGGTPVGPFTVNVTGLTQGASYTFKAYATNSTGTTYSTIGNFTTSTLIITPAVLPNTLTRAEYNQTIVTTGGTAPYTYTLSGGTLPTGLTLNSSGFLSGIPTTEGFFTFTITSTDFTGAARAQTYVLFVAPAVTITTTALPDHGINLPGYGFTVEATGGTGAKTFQISDGTLPFGLTLDPSGLITGTPNVPGTFTFTITATDTLNGSASRTFTVVIGGAVTINTVTIPDGTLNQTNYSQTIVASGGTGFKNFAVTGGTLPPGLNLSATGVLSGTPTATGTSNFSVTATDIFGATASRSFTVNINPALAITTASLANLPLNLSLNQTIATSGGSGAKTFAVTSGTLPTGMSLGTDGLISGTATVAGTYNFTITATDAAGATASQAYTIVAGGPIAITPETLTAPVINTAGYSATLSASGGSGARTFAVTSGALPTGLTLTSAGVLSGTATVAGTYNFTVTATDAAGATGNRSYTVVVAPPVMVAQTITFPALQNRIASDGPFLLSATSSSGLPVTFTVSGPATLSGNMVTLTGLPGIVTVTATQVGNTGFLAAPPVVQTFTVTAADRLINLSSRVRIAPDANRTLIAGFVIGGVQSKRVLIRAIGPALGGFGVTGALVNPRLQIFDSAQRVILENDDWSGADISAASAQVGAFALTAGSRDAAVVTTLAPGSYTVQITAGTETGIGLVEVYDASPNPGAEAQRLVNISTRAMSETGDGVLIGGFFITGSAPKRVLIRGIGPGLAAFGVGGTLADPNLTVFSGSTIVARNDDWSVPMQINPQQVVATAAELTSVAQAVGAFALGAGSRDSAVIVTLAPGAYTAQVAGAGTTTGVALVEIYEIP